MIFPFITLGIFFLVNPISGRHQIPNPKLAKHDVPPSWPQSEGLTYENLKILLQETPDAQKAREWSHYYTSGAHLAGKNLSQAEWTRDKWLEFGIHHAEIVEYEVYLNYPNSHELRVVENGKVKYEALLTEDVLEEDPTTGSPDSIPTFHGYSASGNVTAPFIFCNQGTAQDFDDLEAARYSLEGKIAIVKYGGDIFRSLKVKNAQERGMVGVVMYSDPGDDGKFTVGNGYLAYPDGPARHPSSVQRGSVMYLCKLHDLPTHSSVPLTQNVNREWSGRSYNPRLPFQARRSKAICQERDS
jgi:N-acetylated-alpha-linked acidic dipeptidase